MTRRLRHVIPALRVAESIAAPAIARGRCDSRAEYRACSALARTYLRGMGAYRDALAGRAFAALPKPGSGQYAYYVAVTYPNFLRRDARDRRLHPDRGYGTRFD